MVKNTLVSTILVRGDMDEAYKALKKTLEKINFKVISSKPPNKLTAMRGKGGLLNTKIKNCKTILEVSLKESLKGDEINILFDYTFELLGLFTDNDKEFVLGELQIINHDLFAIAPSDMPKFYKEFKKKGN